jgi:hypothetical protein
LTYMLLLYAHAAPPYRRFFTSLRGRGARRPSPMHRRLDDVTMTSSRAAGIKATDSPTYNSPLSAWYCLRQRHCIRIHLLIYRDKSATPLTSSAQLALPSAPDNRALGVFCYSDRTCIRQYLVCNAPKALLDATPRERKAAQRYDGA